MTVKRKVRALLQEVERLRKQLAAEKAAHRHTGETLTERLCLAERAQAMMELGTYEREPVAWNKPEALDVRSPRRTRSGRLEQLYYMVTGEMWHRFADKSFIRNEIAQRLARKIVDTDMIQVEPSRVSPYAYACGLWVGVVDKP